MLSDDEIDLVRASFARIAETPEIAAGLFYQRLFEIAPDTRPLFGDDIRAQGLKFMDTLGVVVAQMHAFESMRPLLSDLSRRHVTYGVLPRHYAAAGKALIWVVEHVGRPCPETRKAWIAAYGEIGGAMIASGYTGGARPVDTCLHKRPSKGRARQHASRRS